MTAADRVRGTAGSLASMLSSILSARHDMAARVRNVDLIAVLLALVLPWSTSGVGIAVVLWLVAVAAVLEPRPFLRSLQRPISALPIALVALAALGTLWSDASWAARQQAVSLLCCERPVVADDVRNRIGHLAPVSLSVRH